jgi:hypothetical protein
MGANRIGMHETLDAGVRNLRSLGAVTRHDGERVILFRGLPGPLPDLRGIRHTTKVIVASLDPWVAAEATDALLREMRQALEEACHAYATGIWTPDGEGE